MADASSIRKTTTPLTFSTWSGNPGPLPGTLPGVNKSVSATLDDLRTSFSSSAGFYESAIRFANNPLGYNYTYTNSNNQVVTRNTGQAYVNTGQQWCPIGNQVILDDIGTAAVDAFAGAIYLAERPYNVLSFQAVVNTAVGATSTAALYSAPATPTVVISGPGTGATAIANVTAGVIQSFTVINGGSGYGSVASAVSVTLVGTYATAAVVGAVTLSGGAITAIALTSGGTGYVNPIVLGQVGCIVTSSIGGTGAVVVPTVAGGILTAFVVLAGGTGYTAATTTITVTGTNTAQALAGTIVCTAGAITSVALSGTNGTGYVAANSTASLAAYTPCTQVSNPINLNPASSGLNVIQTGSLVSSIPATQIATGARLGIVFNGTAPTAAVGTCQIVLQPS
jgi:hypothetical protein